MMVYYDDWYIIPSSINFFQKFFQYVVMKHLPLAMLVIYGLTQFQM